jgi:hypothetical protein
MTNMCQSLKCLPSPGGLLDQDSLLVIGMNWVVDAQGKKHEIEENQRHMEQRRQGR